MPGRCILVTGASGKLGGYVRAILDADPQVTPIYVNGPRSGGPDLTDTEVVKKLVADSRPEAIFHLAGLLGAACDSDATITHAVNVEATRVLAEAASEAGVRHFIFASTAAVYGDQLTSPADERAPTAGTSSYATSKLAAETALDHLDSSEMARVSLRIFNIYGDGFGTSLVNRLRASSRERPVTLNGLDTFVRDYVHAADVADAFLNSVRLGGGHTVVNIGGGEPVSNRELVRRLERSQPVYFRSTDAAASYSCADITKARTLIGFEPRLLA